MSDDITFCTGEGCPMKDKCFRHVYYPCDDRLYSYFTESPYDGIDCDFYMEIKHDTTRQNPTST